MCLITYNSAKVAESSKVVFKTGDYRWPIFSRFHSLYNCFSYNRLKITESIDIVERHRIVNQGYHSFKTPGMQVFIIPKGAKYYYGNHENQGDGYTSSQIMWVGSILNPFTWVYVLLLNIGAIICETKPQIDVAI